MSYRSPRKGESPRASPASPAAPRFTSPSAAPRQSSVFSPYHQEIAFPSFVAGDLGTAEAESAWRMTSTSNTTSTSSSSTSVAARRAIIDQAIREAESMEARQTYTTSSSNIGGSTSYAPSDPLLDPAFDSQLRAATSAALDSAEDDALTVGGVRLLKLANEELRRVVQRKEDQLVRFDAEMKDLAHIIDVQTRHKEHRDALQKEWTAREHGYQQAVESLRMDRDQHSHARERLDQEVQMERSEHAKTRAHFKTIVEAQEAKIQAMRHEMEARENARQQHEAQSKATRDELELRCDAVASSETQAQERARAMETQLRQATQVMAEMESKLRHTLADAEYLARDLATTRQQLAARDDAVRALDQTTGKQKVLVDQLSKELGAVHADYTGLQAELQTRPTQQSYELLKQRLEKERDTVQACKSESESLARQVRQGEQEIARLEGKVQHHSEHLALLQAKQADLLVESVAAADLRQQLAMAQAEADHAKSQNRTLTGALQEALADRTKLDAEVKELRAERDIQTADQSKHEEALRMRNRTLKMLGDQMKALVDKNPLFDSSAKSNAVGTTTTTASSSNGGGVEDDSGEPASSSSSASSGLTPDQEFLLLRDSLNALLLSLHTRTRQAYSAQIDALQSLQTCEEELAAKKRLLHASQREAAEAKAEAIEAYQTLEQRFFQLQQDLLVARTDALEHASAEGKHRQQLRGIWSACTLLVRTLRPLQARYHDLVQQKALVEAECSRLTEVAREVCDLRKVLASFEQAVAAAHTPAGGTSEEGAPLAALTAPHPHASPRHPYLLHTRRISFRAGVISVLAARRLWRMADGRYGVVVPVGMERIVVTKEAPPSTTMVEAASFGSSSASSSARHSTGGSSSGLSIPASFPAIDDSNAARAATSLVHLVAHVSQHCLVGSSADRFLHRPPPSDRRGSYAGERSLMEGLIEGHNAWKARVRAAAASSSTPSYSRSSHDDLTLIRSIALHLAQSNKDLRAQWQSAQVDYVRLIQQSNRTEEALQHEQQRALEQLRLHGEASRHAEDSSSALIQALRAQLQTSESERTRLITREEYADLHQTSELVLAQCRDLERANEQLQIQCANGQEREHRLQGQLKDKEDEVQHLRRVVDEKQKTLVDKDRGMHVDLQSVHLELQRAQNTLRDREQELSEARQQMLSLQTSNTQLDLDRTELTGAFDSATRELARTQEVLRAISDADRVAVEQATTPHLGPHSTRMATSTTTHHTTMAHSNYRASPRLSPPRLSSDRGGASSSASASAHQQHLHQVKETFTAAAPSTSAPGLHVRHHPDGNLSVDFTGPIVGAPGPPAAGAAPAARSPIQMPAASVPLLLHSSPSVHPLSHQYTPRPSAYSSSSYQPSHVPSSASSAYSADRGLTTPASRHQMQARVQFASDTKAR